MRSIVGSLFVLMMIATLAPESASARLFRRVSRSRSSYSTSNVRYSTNVSNSTSSESSEESNSESEESAEDSTKEASAETTEQTTQPSTSESSWDVSTAQGVANIMAQTGRVGHWGGNPGYEGCGCGSSPEAAYNACCYSRSRMATVDVGYAQGSNGMWFCCRRYR